VNSVDEIASTLGTDTGTVEFRIKVKDKNTNQISENSSILYYTYDKDNFDSKTPGVHCP